jgi:hypothetical protein
VTLGFDHDQPPPIDFYERRHVEAPALVDDGQNVTAQIDDAFEEFRGFGQSGDLLRHPRDLYDGVDGQTELVVRETKDEECQLLAGARRRGLILPIL